jgi:hypothetical protein
MSRPRAADDFPMIRSRMVELRRERERALAEQDGRSPVGPRLFQSVVTGDTDDKDDRILPRSSRRLVQEARPGRVRSDHPWSSAMMRRGSRWRPERPDARYTATAVVSDDSTVPTPSGTGCHSTPCIGRHSTEPVSGVSVVHRTGRRMQ